MNILYSNVIEVNKGWGAEWFINRAFNQIGIPTHCINYRKYRPGLLLKFWESPDCDVFFLQRGDYFPLSVVEAVNRPRFFWASELLSRRHDQDHLIKSGLFEHIFFHTKMCIQRAVEEHWIDLNQCSVLLNAFNDELHRKMEGLRKEIDILFIGSNTPRREKILSQIPHKNLVVASAFGTEMVRLINQSKIVLNIRAADFLDTETKIYEVLGCRSFLLSETLPEENPFSSEDLIEFNGINELIDKIGYFLSHEDERESIARMGHIHALEAHAFKHRAKQIVNIFDRYKQSSTFSRMVNRDLLTWSKWVIEMELIIFAISAIV